MYLDTVVVAGIVTVLLLLAFFVGFGIFIMKDQKANDIRKAEKKEHKNNIT